MKDVPAPEDTDARMSDALIERLRSLPSRLYGLSNEPDGVYDEEQLSAKYIQLKYRAASNCPVYAGDASDVTRFVHEAAVSVRAFELCGYAEAVLRAVATVEAEDDRQDQEDRQRRVEEERNADRRLEEYYRDRQEFVSVTELSRLLSTDLSPEQVLGVMKDLGYVERDRGWYRPSEKALNEGLAKFVRDGYFQWSVKMLDVLRVQGHGGVR